MMRKLIWGVFCAHVATTLVVQMLMVILWCESGYAFTSGGTWDQVGRLVLLALWATAFASALLWLFPSPDKVDRGARALAVFNLCLPGVVLGVATSLFPERAGHTPVPFICALGTLIQYWLLLRFWHRFILGGEPAPAGHVTPSA